MSRTTGSYFDKALCYTNGELIETMRHRLNGVKYDTIVGTGLSGTIFTARVAPGLGKSFAIVRKKDDKSTHSGTKVEGIVGERWVFADDFISSGATFKRVLEMMKAHRPNAQFVGAYEYERECFSDVVLCEQNYSWVADIAFGGPLYGPLTRAEMKRRFPWGPHVRTCPEGGWAPEVAHLVPLPEYRLLELDYIQDGQPSFWNLRDGCRIYAGDKRVKDLVEMINNSIVADNRYNRYVGMRLDTLLREIAIGRYRLSGARDWHVTPGEPLKGFTEAMRKADEAAALLLQKVEAQPYSA